MSMSGQTFPLEGKKVISMTQTQDGRKYCTLEDGSVETTNAAKTVLEHETVSDPESK